MKNTSRRNTDLPRVYRDRVELMVQGRALVTVPNHGRAFMSHFMSPDMLCTRLEIPRSRYGDVICVLKGCPSFACLREKKGHDAIVGTTPVPQSIVAQVLREGSKGSYTYLQKRSRGYRDCVQDLIVYSKAATAFSSSTRRNHR